jgi:hypothetical protein
MVPARTGNEPRVETHPVLDDTASRDRFGHKGHLKYPARPGVRLRQKQQAVSSSLRPSHDPSPSLQGWELSPSTCAKEKIPQGKNVTRASLEAGPRKL